jgi:hypothetical protein
MRKLSEVEVLSLTTLLTIERDGLAVSKAMHPLISDVELKKQYEAGMLASEGRIKGIQQFISENQITLTGEVQ